MSRPTLPLIILALASAACASMPDARPAPLQSPNGRLGFSLAGIAQFTRDEALVEVQVRQRLQDACGGEIELLALDLADATNSFGTPHTAYSAVAECRPAS